MTESARGSERRHLTAIVLAGGRSSRFGAQKLDAPLGDTTVLGATLDRVATFADEILVVGRVAGSTPGSTPRSVRWLDDRTPFEGPLAGLGSALEVVTSAIVVVVGGDMPLVHPHVVRLLVDEVAGTEPAHRPDAAALLDAGFLRPLPAALRREPALIVAQRLVAGGDRALRALIARLETSSVAEDEWRALDPAADTLVDVDVAADLDRLRARFAAHALEPGSITDRWFEEG